MDKIVFTELHGALWPCSEREKILLYAGNFCINSPLVLIALGKIYLNKSPEQSAGNFSFSTKVTTVTKNTYNKYYDLPKIS